ncbi:MAG: hypothetical protein E6230_19980 [Paenibacillus dendritiformis]|uniref:hypothetical protein n=1 Tax=uncultured Paenibacillus sp. TaxID=227322 RepID=UPI0025FF8F70|nr:hypothetical protein [uncultured Paenibacillus sp.]MDU5144452.1 hypothetical protein [Paenibacillus dendritiformis]
MEKGRIEQIAGRLLERSGLPVTISIERRFPGHRLVGGKYSLNSRTITMYSEAVAAQCVQLFGSPDRGEDYFAVVVAHELGHAADAELERLSAAMEKGGSASDIRRIALRIEENAWAYAVALLPEIEGAFIQAIIEESLQAYREQDEGRTA